jgi:hypothetical protein
MVNTNFLHWAWIDGMAIVLALAQLVLIVFAGRRKGRRDGPT